MKRAVLYALLAALAVAQDTVTVEGVVVNKVTGAGIGGVTVRFWTNTNNYDILTNETGTFQITGIKPGDYRSSVVKSGYFDPGSEVLPGNWPKHHISPAGDPVRLRFELNPPASLHGRVVDINGNPVRAAVDLSPGWTASTNADGDFAFGSIPPGPYTLLARPKVSEHVSRKDEIRTEVVPTYYPSVVDRSRAESIMVRAGAQLDGYEIRLQSVPVYRVRGRVLDPDGKPAAKAVVELRARIADGSAAAFLYTGVGLQAFSIRNSALAGPDAQEPIVTAEDGLFEFPSVPAGEWTVRAESDPGPDEIRHRDISNAGSATFSLGRGDPDDLKIQLLAPFSSSGIVALSDGSPAPPGTFVFVSLYSESYSNGGVNTDAGGALRFDNVIPAAYQIRAEVVGGNYYADSIFFGSTNVTGQTVELTPASPPLKIVLKPAGTIRGTIEDADAATVVLFPQSFAGVAYSASSGSGRTFALDGIPPGDYYAIAVDHFDTRTMAEAVRLRGLMPMATSVRMEQGSSVSLQLKVHRLAD
jgi:protocatechuate 3,4-dioxygenase beta subunit